MAAFQNTIRISSCALLLIDVQRGAVANYSASNPQLMQNLAAMVAAAHERHIPVIYTRLSRRPDLEDQFNLFTDAALASGRSVKENKFSIEGTEEAEIAPPLKPEARDFIVLKRRQSAFYGTDLEVILRALGTETILFAGVATEFGVESTVRNARDRDFHCVVLSDCCASRTKESHEYPIRAIFPAMARVMTAEKALSIMVP